MQRVFMGRQTLAGIGFSVLLLVPVAHAAEPAAPGTPAPPSAPAGPRYSFSPVEGGALKLDTQTGQVSFCGKGSAGYSCEAVPDSRDAYEAEIARLQARIATLEGKPATAPNAGSSYLPSQSDFDAALDYAERAFRRLRDLVNGTPSGDRT
ncbi:MAG: hypothetical protein B7Y12_15180 [Rhizobiales bacterium 24-66-13]|jgi:hypothetical protein|nr:MAG: hypothetical protein B7Y61_10270 [Rhizobiales bacterium 35-66-30]OYZ73052.1 MAG: hypothetical protein B7Y12_15180 [Rhizobiales bacterium 24-66-13]OZA96637.1 MAG: hypothetical protein B7X67_23900 [Rhizobiales bacterium 39-66-18]